MTSSLDILNELRLRMNIDNWSVARQRTCIRIAQFLETPLAAARLDVLEQDMIAEANRRLNQLHLPALNAVTQQQWRADFGARTRPRDPNQAPLPPTQTHLLSDVLSHNEQNRGFQLYPRVGRNWGQTVTYLTFIPPDRFRENIRASRHWKDPLVPGGHGEFSHRIQWYLVTNNVPQPAEGWQSFYEWVGRIAHQIIQGGDDAGWAALGLWDALFDRNNHNAPNVNGPYNTNANTDFRSPENMQEYIINVMPDSLLKRFTAARQQKRDYILANDVRIQDYVAKKLHQRRYNQLTVPQQQIVDQLVADNYRAEGIVQP